MKCRPNVTGRQTTPLHDALAKSAQPANRNSRTEHGIRASGTRPLKIADLHCLAGWPTSPGKPYGHSLLDGTRIWIIKPNLARTVMFSGRWQYSVVHSPYLFNQQAVNYRIVAQAAWTIKNAHLGFQGTPSNVRSVYLEEQRNLN